MFYIIPQIVQKIPLVFQEKKTKKRRKHGTFEVAVTGRITSMMSRSIVCLTSQISSTKLCVHFMYCLQSTYFRKQFRKQHLTVPLWWTFTKTPDYQIFPVLNFVWEDLSNPKLSPVLYLEYLQPFSEIYQKNNAF